MRNVILYCNGRVPETVGEDSEHWKDEIPALEESEVIRDFALIAKQGAKRVFHCLVEKNAQLPRIVAWIDAYNEGKADADKIWYWSGRTAEDAYTALWQDEENFAHAVAERVLQYPIEIAGGLIFVSVYEAINTYEVEIVLSVLKEYGVPHKFLGA